MLRTYALGRARVEHITQQVSSDYQVEVLQGEGADEPWGCKVRVKTDPTCHDTLSTKRQLHAAMQAAINNYGSSHDGPQTVYGRIDSASSY